MRFARFGSFDSRLRRSLNDDKSKCGDFAPHIFTHHGDTEARRTAKQHRRRLTRNRGSGDPVIHGYAGTGRVMPPQEAKCGLLGDPGDRNFIPLMALIALIFTDRK